MDAPASGAPPAASEPAGGDRLDSWKEIAGYLKRDVTTVQRWEKREGMPVHRHLHDKQGSVYAFRSELDAWAVGRSGRRDDAVEAPRPEEPDVPPPASRVRPRVVVAAVGALVVVVVIALLALRPRPDDGARPVEDARYQVLTDFDGIEQAAAISRDGRFVAFLSDRDGRPDVWVTQVGTGRFYNLTRGAFPGLVNPSVRTLGFSPDGALVTFWARRADASGGGGAIGIWAVPTLGGQPHPYLEGVAEFDWSADGARLVYHTPGPGDPTFVREGKESAARPLFTAAPGLHAHFPLWSPDRSFVYFVQGVVPDAMDVWRIRAEGGAAERVTAHASRVSHPVLLDDRTLMYLAADEAGGGPWLYRMDLERRSARRVSAGMDRFTSLAAAADGRRLVLTIANPKRTLWRLTPGDPAAGAAGASPIALTTASGFAPRLGPGYLLYVSSRGASDGIWKLANGVTTELWTAPEARIVGRPALDLEGRRVAFSVARQGKTELLVMDADGTDARVVTGALDLRGAPAWAPDGASITTAAAGEGNPALVRVALDGAVTPFGGDHALDPAWSPRGDYVVYSGADVGTTFPVKAMSAAGGPHALPALTLTRGARRLRIVDGGRALVAMRGDLQHRDLWRIDLVTGAEKRLTALPPDFDVRDFDVAGDGREIVLERVQEHSDVVLLETGGR